MKKETLLEFYSKYKMFIFPGVVALAGIFLIVVVIFPQIRSYLQEQNQIKSTQAKLEKLDAKAAELQGVNEEVLRKNVVAATTVLPSDKDLSFAVSVLQGIGNEVGVNISSLQVANQGSGKTVSEASGFSVKIEILSPKTALPEFLSKIEKASLAMNVTDMEINASKDSNALSGSLTIEVFYAPTPTSLGDIDSDLPKLTQEDENLLTALGKVVKTVSAQGTTGTSEAPPVNIPVGKSNPFE